jgi:periplasmic protein TonB
VRRVTRVSRPIERREPQLTPIAGPIAANADELQREAEAADVRGQVIRGPWVLQIAPTAPVGSRVERAALAGVGMFGFRPGLKPSPAAIPAAQDMATVLVPDAALRFPAMRRPKPALIIVACVVTVLCHLLPAGLLLRAPQSVGAGGMEIEAVSIEIVDASVLDAQRETRDDGAGGAQSVAATTGNNAIPAPTSAPDVAKETAQDAPSDKSTAMPAEQKPEQIPQPVLVVPDGNVTVDVTTETTTEPLQNIFPDVKLMTPAIPSAAAAPTGGSVGGAEAASKTATPWIATAGRVAASQGEINRFVAGIRASLARTKPSGRGRFGTALVVFAIDVDGQLGQLRIEKTSGNTALDQAALDAVRRAAPFRAPPAGMADAVRRFVIPYQFE